MRLFLKKKKKTSMVYMNYIKTVFFEVAFFYYYFCLLFSYMHDNGSKNSSFKRKGRYMQVDIIIIEDWH